MRVFIAVFLLSLAALFGCVEGFKIEVIDSGNGNPIFELKTAGLISTSGVEIDSFNVYLSPGNAKDYIWGIRSKDNKRHLLKTVKYGELPDGFEEVTSPKHLVSGNHYIAGTFMAGKISSTEFILK